MIPSNTPILQNNENFCGYKSEKAKKDFTMKAGILFGCYLLLQFILIFGYVFYFLTSGIQNLFSNVKSSAVNRGTFWNGSFWYPESDLSPSHSKDRLKRINFAECSKPEDMGEILVNKSHFLADRDRIWLISANGVQEYKDGKLNIICKEKMAEISPPFFYDGHPATIETTSSGSSIQTLHEGKWREETEVFIVGDKEEREKGHIKFQVVNQGLKLHFFCRRGSYIYYRDSVPLENDKDMSKWELVGPVDGEWKAFILGDHPAVILWKMKHPFERPSFIGLWKEGSKWEQFLVAEAGIVSSIATISGQNRDEFKIIAEGFPGSLHLYDVKSGKIIAKKKLVDGNFPFSPKLLNFVILFSIIYNLLPLPLVFILSKTMKEYRVESVMINSRLVHFASVFKRGIARAIDLIIYYAPSFLLNFYIFWNAANFEDMFMPWGMLKLFLFICLIFTWIVLVGIVFSYTEGKWGQSPGKWLMKIKVVSIEDLEPCGFWKGILRTVCLYVDCLFTFLVGIALITFTQNQQRIGDFAAKTIVIDIEKGQ